MKTATKRSGALAIAGGLGAALIGCTGQIPGSIRLMQQTQTFSSQLKVNTKIDLLFVVDNSSSMDSEQAKLRQGFSAFAKKYMQSTWDIQVAVIPTDAYVANPAYASYLRQTIPGTGGWKSPYIASRPAPFVNPSIDTNMLNTSTLIFNHDIPFNDLIPSWGPNYAKLMPGIHDGPIAGFCFEGMPYFLHGAANCANRDNQDGATGPANCLAGGVSDVTDCVNTMENDTIHSGEAIIATMPSSPLAGAALTAWDQQLLNNFTINVTTGSAGSGSERGLQSVLQLISDNEAASSPSRFFRPGSLRGIVFVSDEDDQTMAVDNPVPAGYQPFSHYFCDQSSLLAMNTASRITGAGGYCCNTPGNNCTFGSEGLSCQPKTVDGHTYTISICPNPSLLIPVSQVKDQLDAFFLGLDGAGATNPSYFIASIVSLSGASIQSMQAIHDVDDANAGVVKNVAVDRGDRYIALGNLVGNGSLALDIGASDYSPLLDSIGQAIITAKSVFTLARAPTDQENIIIQVIHADGSTTSISPSQYTIDGKNIVITDQSLVLSFTATDVVSINYEPKTAY